MTTKEDLNDYLQELLSEWIKIEDLSISSTTDILKKSENPIVHIVMEIIRQDSVMHRKIQQLLLNNINTDLKLSKDEVNDVIQLIEQHNIIEMKSINYANECISQLNNPIQKLFFEYLLNDENKHFKLLDDIQNLTKK